MGSALTKYYARKQPISKLSMAFPPPSKFTTNNIPDLSGMVIMVTGGNTGIGYAICSALLKQKAKVYLACRSEPRGKDAISRLKAETGREPVLLMIDLSDMYSVQTAANKFLSMEDHLDVLFENAGVGIYDMELKTPTGVDLDFGTNVLGHAYLDRLLLPALEKTLTITGHKARIVINTSESHTRVTHPGGIDWPTLTVDQSSREARKKIGPFGLYGQSKMGCVLHAQWLHNHHRDNLVVTSVNPGNIHSEACESSRKMPKGYDTDSLPADRYLPAGFRFVLERILGWTFYDCDMGALTPLYAGVAPETAAAGGKFLVPWARDGTEVINRTALDRASQEKLREWIDRQIRRVEKRES